MKAIGSILLSADLVTITGLHIGAGRENVEIGGLDLPIVKNPKTNLPYIPGSSVKGKMRFLTEWSEGKVKGDSVCKCGNEDCCVCRIFGSTENSDSSTNKRGPTRLIIRDSELKVPKDFDPFKNLEIKWENTIDRTTGTAKNPRPIERIVPGTEFSFELVYRIFSMTDNDEGEKDYKFFKYVINALKLLENDTLGGSGSRGCGKIAFKDLQVKGGGIEGAYADIEKLLGKLNNA